jgi:hypothetical protein
MRVFAVGAEFAPFVIAEKVTDALLSPRIPGRSEAKATAPRARHADVPTFLRCKSQQNEA